MNEKSGVRSKNLNSNRKNTFSKKNKNTKKNYKKKNRPFFICNDRVRQTIGFPLSVFPLNILSRLSRSQTKSPYIHNETNEGKKKMIQI